MGRHKKVGRKPLPKNIKNQHEQEWRSKNTKLITIRLNLSSDKDIIERLDNVGNKTDYIRNLIKQDMNK